MKPLHSFAEFAPSAESHFRLFSQVAVYRLIHYLRGLAEANDEAPDACLEAHPFLAEYFEAMRPYLPDGLDWEETLAWWEIEVESRERAASSRCALPLRRLAERTMLTFSDRVALILMGLVEEDIRFGALTAVLQEPLPSRRMGQGLLEAILGDDSEGTVSRLLAYGLIRVENRDAPRPDWILRVPLPVWDALRGRPVEAGGIRLNGWREFPPLKRLILEPGLHARTLRLPALLATGQISGVIERGMADSGRRTLLGSLARCLRRDLLYWERPAGEESGEGLTLLGPLCLLTGALPALALDPAPGETITLDRLTGYEGPVGVLLPREGGASGPLMERAITLTLPSPTREERLRFWQSLLACQKGAEVEALATRFRLPLGSIAQASRIATAYAAVEGRDCLCPDDVQNACRALNRQALDLLAQRLAVEEEFPIKSGAGLPSHQKQPSDIRPERYWERLVVSPVTDAALRDLERRCRYRESLNPYLGMAFPRVINPGVRALFNGASGTGKTLAAKTLAGILQMDIYRVDLAAIVNKYIGETEKNLSRLLARAEELDVILLIDEGDSLMSGRTDVRSANDRYANLETNYLLQRLESYEGIIFVTTNASGRVDSAFERRFDAVIDFALPGPTERRLLWERHLPSEEPFSGAFLDQIASACIMTGGQIRNAALHAALLAASESRGMTESDVVIAIRREYRKSGVACPLPDAPRAVAFDPIAAFLAEAK